MNDRCFFLQDEVTVAFVDDFMALPVQYQHENVVVGMQDAQQRHSDFFKFAH